MKKLSLALSTVLLMSSSAFAAEGKSHIGGTIITVPTLITPEVKQDKKEKNFGQKSLFDYGASEKGISKSEKEYREFLSMGSYSRLRTLGVSAYSRVGSVSIGSRVGGRAIYGRRTRRGTKGLRTGGYASLGNRNNRRRGFASLGSARQNSYATLTSSRRRR